MRNLDCGRSAESSFICQQSTESRYIHAGPRIEYPNHGPDERQRPDCPLASLEGELEVIARSVRGLAERLLLSGLLLESKHRLQARDDLVGVTVRVRLTLILTLQSP